MSAKSTAEIRSKADPEHHRTGKPANPRRCEGKDQRRQAMMTDEAMTRGFRLPILSLSRPPSTLVTMTETA